MSEKPKRLTREELEDLEDEFSMQHGDEVGRLEALLVDIYTQYSDTPEERIKRCNDFIETFNQLKDFCKQHGPGGTHYYNNQIKGDLRLGAVKNELKVLKKYPNGPTLENALLELHKYLKKAGAATTKDLYKNFEGFDYPIGDALKLMVKIEAVCLDADYPKVYYLPTDVGRATLCTIRGIQRAEDEKIEQLKDLPEVGLSIDTKQFTDQLDDMITQVDRQIEVEKKKQGLFGKLFGRPIK